MLPALFWVFMRQEFARCLYMVDIAFLVQCRPGKFKAGLWKLLRNNGYDFKKLTITLGDCEMAEKENAAR